MTYVRIPKKATRERFSFTKSGASSRTNLISDMVNCKLATSFEFYQYRLAMGQHTLFSTLLTELASLIKRVKKCPIPPLHDDDVKYSIISIQELKHLRINNKQFTIVEPRTKI
eukprot:scaffold1215_cov116-Chaetoceros_neogracile.AAC.1